MHTGAQPKTFAVYTLGCKVNQYDSEAIARELRELGLRQVPFGQPADAYVIDTCTVTAEADRKSRKAARKAARLQPEAVVAVTGCGPSWGAAQFREIPGVRLITDNAGKSGLATSIAEAVGAATVSRPDVAAPPPTCAGTSPGTTSTAPRTRAYLKVQDGCNCSCAYCIVPRVRGRERSKPLAEALEEAWKRVAEGYRELVVTGVRLGGYEDPETGESLPALLEAVARIEGLARLRVSSIDPPDLTAEVIGALAQIDKVCDHVHLPLQSGEDTILAAMNRGYTAEDFAAQAARLREALPEVGITTDVMVGFPGESETQFEATARLCEEVGFSRLHVFQYSARPRTRAAAMAGQVPAEVKRRRSRRLREVGDRLSQRFAARLCGRVLPVLVEQYHQSEGEIEGLTTNYIRVRARSAERAAGETAAVRFGAAEDGALRGEEVVTRT